MALPEIVVPVTEPETEWVHGRPLQKVSPTRSHALLQVAIARALQDWAGTHGEVGSEWRFRVSPPGEPARPLVPDVAYVQARRLRGLRGDDLEVPRLSPDVAVEVLSPGDRRVDVESKLSALGIATVRHDRPAIVRRTAKRERQAARRLAARHGRGSPSRETNGRPFSIKNPLSDAKACVCDARGECEHRSTNRARLESAPFQRASSGLPEA